MKVCMEPEQGRGKQMKRSMITNHDQSLWKIHRLAGHGCVTEKVTIAHRSVPIFHKGRTKDDEENAYAASTNPS